MLELRKRADKSGDEPEPGTAWPLQHVEVTGDLPAKHNFADTFVARAIHEGYLSVENMRIGTTVNYDRDPVITGDAFILHLVDGDVRYRIIDHPGRYADPDGGPDIVIHEYTCELD